MTNPTVAYRSGEVRLLDQTRLPQVEEVLVCRDLATLIDAIRRLVVRGAPAIGVAAAHGAVMAMDVRVAAGETGAALREGLRADIAELGDSRPTAVNLRWALARQAQALEQAQREPDANLREALASCAAEIEREDIEMCRRMGEHGAALLPDPCTLITHCNTGALATAGIGTALGVVKSAHDAGKRVKVFADETRPLLQGARLTAWECRRWGIDVEVICDGAAGWTMQNHAIDACIVGSDRIAANGDVANKIGTYSLAVLARRHGVPFYVVAPYSTLDMSLATGAEIPIETRDPWEVTAFGGRQTAPEGVGAFNPAFDVTPAELVSAIVTERGVFRPPYGESLGKDY